MLTTTTETPPQPSPRVAKELLASTGFLLARLGLRPWLPALPVPLQFVHEDDVAQALALAVTGTGPPGVYNLAGAGVIDGSDAWELLGLRRLPVPGAVVQAALKGLLALPAVVPALHWPGLITEPILIDPGQHRRRLERTQIDLHPGHGTVPRRQRVKRRDQA